MQPRFRVRDAGGHDAWVAVSYGTLRLRFPKRRQGPTSMPKPTASGSSRRFRPVVLVATAWLAPALALTPVANFEIDRYMGTWYEIAAIPGFLQSRCARDTHLEYTRVDNGAIATKSHCMRADGTVEVNEGRARPLDPELPSVLKVTSVHLLG